MTVNGEEYAREVEPRLLLVHFLRDELGLTGTHWGCDTSNCGVCVVLMDGEPVKSCTVLAATAAGHEIRTVEGLEVDGVLDPVQQGFMEEHGLQCGFCTPGMMLTARALLDRNPDPTDRRDPRGDLGPDLPLHRLRDHRPLGSLGGRAPLEAGGDGPMATVEESANPIGFGRMKRKEDVRFVRGQGNYVDDVQLPGMLHGAILRSPVAHARIVSIDTRRRSQHPKVLAVVTGKDLEGLGLAWMPTLSYDTQAVLATDKVRFQGQEVAFVIAEDRYAARDALELIDVEYDTLPAVVNARKALDADAPGHPRRQGGQDRQPHLRLGVGRPRGDRRRVRPRRGRGRGGHALPALAPGADGDLRGRRRLRQGQRQAHALVHDPGAACAPHRLRARRRAPGAQDPGHLAATSAAVSATRCRSIPATCAPSSARSSPASP